MSCRKSRSFAGMDQDSINKWKEELKNERQEQFMKVKQLQKETQKRRRAMELKVKLEQAKEEKRRKEALAERRAIHIEATMRYQKGIKNFKMTKERISLEEALKSVNRPKKRVTSADDRSVLNESLNSSFYRSKSAVVRPSTVNIKKSSSFDNISLLTAHFNKQQNQHQQQQPHDQYNKSKYDDYDYDQSNNSSTNLTNENLFTNNNNNNINQNMHTKNNSQTLNLYKEVQNEHKTNDLITNKNIYNANNSHSNLINTNTTTNNNNNNNFKIIIEENQKNIQDINKEALKDFKNLVMNEIHSTNQQQQQFNTTTPNNATIANATAFMSYNNSNKIDVNNNNDKVSNYLISNNNNNKNNDLSINKNAFKYDSINNNNINNVNNHNHNHNQNNNKIEDTCSLSSDDLSSDSEDSLEVNTKLNKTKVKNRIGSATVNRQTNAIASDTFAHTLNSNDNINNNSNIISNNVNSNLINGKTPLETNFNTTPTTNDDKFNNKAATTMQNHFTTKTLATDYLTNSLLSNKKTYFTPQYNNNNNNSTTTTNATTFTVNNINFIDIPSSTEDTIENNSFNNMTYPNNQRQRSMTFVNDQKASTISNSTQIKSILKRSTSDNNVNLMGQFNPFSSFGIRAEKIEIKDSLEVAKHQTKPPIKPTPPTKERKKSVRFAQNESNTDSEQETNNNNKENNEYNSTLDANPRISSANSIKRPVVKPRTIVYNRKTSTFETVETNDELNSIRSDDSSSKPPLPSSISPFNDNTYSVLGMRRKEFLDKNKITSPRSQQETLKQVTTNQFTPQTNIRSELTEDNVKKVQQQYTTTSIVNQRNQPTNNQIVQSNQQTVENNTQNTRKNDNVVNTFNNKYGNSDDRKQVSIGGPKFNYVHQNTNNDEDQQSNDEKVSNNMSKKPPQPQPYKQFLKTYSNTSVVEIQELPPTSTNNLVRRPFSANTPLTNQNNNDIGSHTFHQNTIIYQNQHPPKINSKLSAPNTTHVGPISPQRVMSADYVNQQFRYRKYFNSPVIQLKIQYPLSTQEPSNAQNQSNNDDVSVSMAHFLRAEEMCNTGVSESKIISNLNNFDNHKKTAKTPLTISMEEQNVKQSIQRLNEKLNVLSRKYPTGVTSNLVPKKKLARIYAKLFV